MKQIEKSHVIIIQEQLSHQRKDFDKLFMSPPSVTHERTRSLSQHGSYPRAAENQMPGKPSWEQKITRPPVPHCDMFQASTCSRLFKKLS